MPRYIVQRGTYTITTPVGPIERELWIGLETPEPVNLEFLSRCGWHLVPADHLTEEMLGSVGVDGFERVELPVDAEG